MGKITGLAHIGVFVTDIGVFVTDIEQSKKFYTDILGLKAYHDCVLDDPAGLNRYCNNNT